MRRKLWVVAALAALGMARAPAAEDKGGAIVDLDGLRSKTPASWKEEAPISTLRLVQFRLPKKGDDKYDAEVIVFKNAGGNVRDNIARWKGQFKAPEGKTIDDLSKVEEIKIGGREATLLDIQGTYMMKRRPMDPTEKPEPREDYRMVAIQLQGPENLYHIKFTGPTKTFEAYQKGFDEWIKGFKKE